MPFDAPTYFGTPIRDYNDVIRDNGGVITEPGIYINVPSDTYHRDFNLFGGDPGVSSGILRRIENECLEKVWDGYIGNPDHVPAEDKDAYIFGRAVHTLYAGEKDFNANFIKRPDTYTDPKTGLPKKWIGSAKECKEWLKWAASVKRSVLTGEEIEDIKGMAIRLAKTPFIQSGGLSGLIECSIFYYRDIPVSDADGATGYIRVWIKSRPDALPLSALMNVDFKTTADASAKGCRESIGKFGYEQQMALGAEAIKAITGLEIEDHVLIFQETKRPYCVNVKPLTSLAIEYGRRQNERALSRFAQAWHDKNWPSYDDDEVPANLPEWKMKRLAFDAEHGLLPQA